ncbi:MAG: hypothetical protein JO368_01020 [Acidimicrobiales bacterium]|nr:hypothetical protein [Acidimicrobiales bacterium]
MREAALPPVWRISARGAARSGALWGYLIAAVVASSAWTYGGFYKTAAQRARLEDAYGQNHALAALFGPFRLDSVGQFTLFKTFVVVVVLASLWGLLTTTRWLRGEEEAGRFALLVAGPTTVSRTTLLSVLGTATGVLAIFAVTAAAWALVGSAARVHVGAGAAVFFALVPTSCASMFAAVGALTSQLAATRRQAAGLAGLVLGLSYAIRLVADSSRDLTWLRWLSPIGWTEQLHPLGAASALPFLPIVGLTLGCVAGSVLLAGHRDVGAGILPDHSSVRRRFAGGSLGLAARLTIPTGALWCLGVVAGGLLFGFVAQGSTTSLSGSVLHVLSRLGASGGPVRAYLGVAFLMTAFVVALLAASLAQGLRREEGDGHLVHLLTRPLSRSRWYCERLVVAVGLLTVAGALAGLATWIGGSGHGGAPLGTLLAAGLNVVPPAACVLGVGALAFGVWPRATGAVAYGVLTWSLLVEVVAGVGPVNHWLLDTSLFHQMSAAPSVPPDLTVVVVLVSIAVASGSAGLVAFRRRDLVGD